MKLDYYVTIFAFTLCVPVLVVAQSAKDTTKPQRKYTLGVLPAIAYDSDLGFQYGALANIYLHSSAHPYPQYGNSLYAEASRFTAGSTLLRFLWDSKTLVKPFRTNFNCSYTSDLTRDFYGFNGAATLLDSDYENEASPNYISRVFYKFDTKMLRVMGNIKGNIAGKPWYWITGFSLIDYSTKPVDLEKINDMHPSKPLPNVEGLYEKYLNWGLIKHEEADGGFNLQLRGGFGFDSRDFESNPSKGVWSEVLISTIPSLTTTQHKGNLQITAVHRQYIKHAPTNTIFAYRLLANLTPMGETPYYLIPSIPTSWLTGSNTEGLGGAKTLRGIRRNRVVGKGIALANIELRQRISSFSWKKQDFYIASNIFTDGGLVIQEYPVDLSKVPEADRTTYFSGTGDRIHVSYGLGLKLAMNENFIVSADFGMATNKQDGSSGLYIDLNYLF